MSEPILRAQNISQHFYDPRGSIFRRKKIVALDRVSLDVYPNRTLAIVGESGSGKSTLAKILLRLQEPSEGTVSYRDLSYHAFKREDRDIFCREVQAVFQDPSSSLSPRMTLGQSLSYIVNRHNLVEKKNVHGFLAEQLTNVEMNPPEVFLDRYPHQLSGGQQQRIAIARAMMLSPSLIIADEPLSALDVSVQAQVLDLMAALRDRTQVGMVIISHDLGAMKLIADQIAVMYAGKIVEIGAKIFDDPKHPYTQLLLTSQLSMDPENRSLIQERKESTEKLDVREANRIGCPFYGRCKYGQAICQTTAPELLPVDAEQTQVACHFVDYGKYFLTEK